MTRPRLNRAVAIAPDDSGYLAFDTATGRLLHLNPAAALVAELCDGTRTEDDIVAAVAPFFDQEQPDGCREWIRSALESGVLSDDGRSAPSDDAPDAASRIAERAKDLRNQGLVLSAFVCQWHAAHLDPTMAARWYALGELAHIVGRRADAREAYERYLEAEPDDAEIRHLLISLRDEEAPARAPDRCIEQLYERFASFYDQSMRGDLEYQAPEHLDRAVRTVLNGRTELDVLELGCGTGLAGKMLRAHARRLVGLDLSSAMLERASAGGTYENLIQAEITSWLSAGVEPYDLIAACDTLIYFGDLRQVIEPASRRLRPAGLFAFTLERGEMAPFALTDSGRYAHHPDHIAAVAEGAGLTVTLLDEVMLRYEYGEAVRGLVAVLSREPLGSARDR